MRIKELFTVPDGKKVTEKVFSRVLISSICSMLLCMACLAGTTWAWFTVSIENTGNVIEIAQIERDISIYRTSDNSEVIPVDGIYDLNQSGVYQIKVTVRNTAEGRDAFGQKQKVYVSMIVSDDEDGISSYYFEFGDNDEQTIFLEAGATSVKLSFYDASWIKPQNAEIVGTDAIVVGDLQTEATTEPTTEETSEPSTESTTEITELPTEATESSTEPSGELSTETSAQSD